MKRPATSAPSRSRLSLSRGVSELENRFLAVAARTEPQRFRTGTPLPCSCGSDEAATFPSRNRKGAVVWKRSSLGAAHASKRLFGSEVPWKPRPRGSGCRANRNGQAVIEAPLVALVIVVLLVGMVEIAKVSLTYYNLRKAVYSIARYISVQSGVNYCDAADPAITAAINFGLTGTTDASAQTQIPNLTADMISISAERIDPAANTLTPCDCSISGCDLAAGGGSPDYVVVSIPNGFQVTPRLPFLTVDPISLRPTVKVPFGGS